MVSQVDVNANVLVIGGGLGGVWAAIAAKESGAKEVVLVDKSFVGKSGPSTFAAGVIAAWMPGDDLNGWTKEIATHQEYLCDQTWIEPMLRENWDRIQDMDRWSQEYHYDVFEKEADGTFQRVAGRGMKTGRLAQFHGPEAMWVMRRRALQLGVKLVERVMITNLLTSDGRYPTQGKVSGAVGFDTRKGTFYMFRAPAIVLADGACSYKAIFIGHRNVTGDGVRAAFEAGAKAKSMEFAVGHNSTASEIDICGLNMYVSHGARFLNRDGQEFLKKYDPFDLGSRVLQGHLAMGLAVENLEGRGPCHIDLTSISDDTYNKFLRVLPIAMRSYQRKGIDIRKQKIEWVPAFKGGRAMPGGIKLMNLKCETSIPGLFGTGDATDIPVHGCQELVFNLTFCNFSGYRAGVSAAALASEAPRTEINVAQANDARNRIYAPLNGSGGLEPDSVILKIQQAVIPADRCMFKAEERLRDSLERVSEAEANDLEKVSATDVHALVKCHEARSIAASAKMMLTASLFRKESRGAHYREDFPYRDDENWLSWTILQRDGDSIGVWSEPIPIDSYPIKPEKAGKLLHPVARARRGGD